MNTLSFDFIPIVQHHTLVVDDIVLMCVRVCLPDALLIFRTQFLLTTISISSQKHKGLSFHKDDFLKSRLRDG